MKLEKLIEYNDLYRSFARSISVLGTLNWPDDAKAVFLESYEKGNPILPEFEYPKIEYSDKKEKLKYILNGLAGETSIEANFLKSNTESYIYAIAMMQGVGTKIVNEISQVLYGSPYDKLPNYNLTSVEAAKFFLNVESKFKSEAVIENDENEITSEQLKEYLENNINRVFERGDIKVEIDTKMASRASVTSRKVRVRANTIFKKYEAKQLLNHEVFTHALCSINGINQKYMYAMEFTSPRITATQEGLAQFSELITGSIHLNRLKRIAQRIIALDKAINGADFLDIFKFFIENGDTNEEAYMSAMRIFRGGKPKGGIVFFKDGVYIKGMLEVFSFFMNSMEENKLNNLKVLFSGKMTISDVEDMNYLMSQGLVNPPKYIPVWFDNIHNLAAILAFMQFATNLNFNTSGV
ncbi:MAG: DUF1704 domain-containing protein [Rickettsiales bacterium]|nr:DUF1704 domain-containing protein [Rickettsiales bacterium]